MKKLCVCFFLLTCVAYAEVDNPKDTSDIEADISVLETQKVDTNDTRTLDWTNATVLVPAPTADPHAATKKYVDDNAGVPTNDPAYLAAITNIGAWIASNNFAVVRVGRDVWLAYPTNVSFFSNDVPYLVLGDAGASTNLSDYNNDVPFLTNELDTLQSVTLRGNSTTNSMILGTGTANGLYALSQGLNCDADGDYSYCGGWGSDATGWASHAEGHETLASGVSSHAEGNETIASGTTAHAEGNGTIASGTTAHAEGNGTIAAGTAAHAEGWIGYAFGWASHVEGIDTYAHGTVAHAEGYQTVAYGDSSHAEGELTRAYGLYSHAEGYNTIASNSAAHAEGRNTKALGYASHAAGENAVAAHSNTWVWSDGQACTSTAPEQFSIYAQGGIRLDGGRPTHNNTNLMLEGESIDAVVITNNTFEWQRVYPEPHLMYDDDPTNYFWQITEAVEITNVWLSSRQSTNFPVTLEWGAAANASSTNVVSVTNTGVYSSSAVPGVSTWAVGWLYVVVSTNVTHEAMVTVQGYIP